MHSPLPSDDASTELAQRLSDPRSVFNDSHADAMHACKILIIDDEPPNVRLLERVLSRAGFENFVSTTDSREAAGLFATFQPDLVLTDWLMPEVDGCAVIEQLRALTATNDYLPILVLTADVTASTKMRALIVGATDFLTKPFDQVEILLRIHNLLKTRLSHVINQTQSALLEVSVRERTIDLEKALAELRQTQEHVIQQERLSALGAMAGGIAHDFNNVLSVIMGFGELLLRDAEGDEKSTMPITTILTAAEDGAKIVHRLREFYRPDETEQRLRPVDLNHLVEQAVSLTQPRWGTRATAEGRKIMVTSALGEIPQIMGEPAELREALTNLIFNAVDALPQGGAIALTTRCEGDGAVFEVSDTGIGMTENVRQRCLEPFFSTKGKLGTGLGLSMVFGIIQRHSGSIDVQSEPGKGTKFTIRLRAAEQLGALTPDTGVLSSDPLRILVVEDQPVLCKLLVEQLQDDFHIVEATFSGSEALQKLENSPFDIVITDHVMAEMTGEQLAVIIKQRNPKLPVILLTGYGDYSASGKQYSDAIDLVLSKPLSRVALRQTLEKTRRIDGVFRV